MGGAASIPKSSTMKTEGSLYLCTVTLDRIADSFLPRKPRKLRHVLFSMAWADPCFDRRRPCVLCLWSESKIWGHPGSRYVYIYIYDISIDRMQFAHETKTKCFQDVVSDLVALSPWTNVLRSLDRPALVCKKRLRLQQWGTKVRGNPRYVVLNGFTRVHHDLFIYIYIPKTPDGHIDRSG